MILDRLADLRALAERASSTASALTEDAAFADVQEQVARARSMFVNLGIARAGPLSLMANPERQTVVRSSTQMREALDAIAGATDEELAAYASATPEQRGSLLAVTRQASALRTDLISVQQALLLRLADQIWPEDDVTRLDIISHLSDSLGDTARRAISVRRVLAEQALATDVGIGASELDALINDANRAADDAAPLRAESIEDDIVAFWQAASSQDGASLDDVTASVRKWLEDHEALEAFTIRRRDDG